MADDNKLIVEIEFDDGSIKQGFVRMQNQGNKTANTLEKDFERVGNKIKTAAIGFAAAFVGVQGIRRAINNLKELETSLAEVNTITELTAQQQKNLKNQVIALSAQFGTSAQSQAKAFYQIISAGVTDSAKATELLVSANKLAIGGLTTTASAIDLLTSAVNAFGQNNLSATKASDILFGTVRLGKTTVEELAGSLGQILPSASALGVSFEDINGALAALTTRGISTSEAVTQLNAVLTAVLKQQEAAEKLGKNVASAFSLQALKTKGLTGFLKDLNNTLGGSEEALVKLTGRAEGARAIITLAGDNFNTLRKNVDELKNSTGAADKAFNIIDQTLGQKLNKTLATFDAIVLKASESSGGELANSLSFLNEQLNDILTSFDGFGSIADVIQASFLNIEDSFISLVQTVVQSLSTIPGVGKKIFGDFNTGVLGTLEERRQEIAEKIISLIKGPDIDAAAADAGNRVADGFTDSINRGKAAIEGLSVSQAFTTYAEGFREEMTKLAETADAGFKSIGAAATRGLATGVGNAFAAFGRALVTGENALKAFTKAFLASIGQTAIALGTEFILRGTAYLFVPGLQSLGGPLIAAGAALAAFGGVLGAATGGGATSAGGAGSGASTDNQTDTSLPEVSNQPTNSINVNVNGSIFDSDDTGLRIAQLIQGEIDKSGKSILQVT